MIWVNKITYYLGSFELEAEPEIEFDYEVQRINKTRETDKTTRKTDIARERDQSFHRPLNYFL